MPETSFGEQLKKWREEAGLSKQKVAQFLNINAKTLDYFEQGEANKLPADVYVKGFLKKYAKVLGKSPAVLLANYEKEVAIRQPLKKNIYQSLPQLRFRRFAVTPRLLILVLVAIIIVLVAGYFFYQLNFLISQPKLTISEPADNLTTQSTTILIKGQTEPAAKLTINGQRINLNKDGSFEQEVNLNQGLNLIKIESTNRFGKSNSATRKILVE